MIHELLKKPFAARVVEEPAVALGTELRFERDRLVGRVLLMEDTFLHAVLSLDLLTAQADAAPPPPTGQGTVPAEGEMERRSARSRLTEYERRLLERMRNRRSNPPGRLNPPDPNGTGNQGTGR